LNAPVSKILLETLLDLSANMPAQKYRIRRSRGATMEEVQEQFWFLMLTRPRDEDEQQIPTNLDELNARLLELEVSFWEVEREIYIRQRRIALLQALIDALPKIRQQ
jgi:hypothetical protein